MPLALIQMSNFICDTVFTCKELLRAYEKSAEKVYANSKPPIEYDHILLTTRDISPEAVLGSSQVAKTCSWS